MEARNLVRKKRHAPGAPAWVVTFADMVMLLLGFFILLYSMSDTTSKKFQEASGSLRQAFGMKQIYIENGGPQKNSLVNQAFSQAPAKPVNTDTSASVAASEAQADEMQTALKDITLTKKLEVITDGTDIILRLRDDALFAKDGIAINADIMDTLAKISQQVKKLDKHIVIAAHTDDSATSTYKSNWELSSTKAATLAQILMKLGLDSSRFSVTGYAGTRPLLANNSLENRAKNRRLEIVLKNEKP